MSSSNPRRDQPEDDAEVEMLAEDDVHEMVEDADEDGDMAMGSDDEGEEILLQNDSIAYFDGHKDSVFAIAQHPLYPNLIATGGSEGDDEDALGKGYVIDTSAAASRPIVQSYFLHTGACTAGAWTPGRSPPRHRQRGRLPARPSTSGAPPRPSPSSRTTAQTVVSLTEADQRFAVEGGLYSVAISPSGGLLAAGGAAGAIRIVSLPRLSSPSGSAPSQRGGGENQAGTILAALAAQQDGVESLAFSPNPATPLLAAGSVDGSIAVFDPSRSFALRRHLKGAHDGESVVRVDFVRAAPAAAAAGWLLTSCGLDGVVRRWDLRGATASQAAVAGAAASGLVKEWRGHRGGGDGGGVLGFVQGETGERVVTAGDDAVVLVFEA
ncbi:hypothetical protein CHGG_06731 [Chaetomium globosum CBS 148.51]|uniref:Uncharacterized protein n=1 Tax=Chaetomium globosum (strain ATCC 6205 / CBS 148.51 / DSM 1962 / NBRC 6347 / NRRL 1970) TaxID=306901 RepID=Q2H3N4_CHAGB|nr:uncharacterized protein CHGG_06731 [Chaetomium globosum CBS 148.51]EAQ90112.1 hypothetical protein CHGG_06731 [Chaetomium globosum CBS 148.51]